MVVKIFVSISGEKEKISIQCENADETIKKLCENAFLVKKIEEKFSKNFSVRRTSDRSLLSLDDKVQNILNDQESIEIEFSHVKHDEISVSTDEPKPKIFLDGFHLSCEDLVRLGMGHAQIELLPETWETIDQSRRWIDEIVENNQIVYGVTTGFGQFASVRITNEELSQLQYNLIVSHCAGVGDPLSITHARMMFAIRINVMTKGYSGVSRETLEKVVAAFNKGCVPEIPSQGTVGASGDLAPSAHLAAGLMGVGRMWSPKTDWGEADNVLKKNGLEPIKYKPKEGLAMINGTQFMAALGADGVVRSLLVARQADVVAALSLEALHGTVRALDPRIHEARPHEGQNLVARRLRSVLSLELYSSEISQSHAKCGRVQDAYSLRCIPQIHGISWDTIKFAEKIITTEMNSATDNPLVMLESGDIVCGGNFHGEYPAKALDMLAIAVHEIGSLSACRMERLINKTMSSDLPAFLVRNGGLNSGFMIAHCTAVALVSENKGLCHPSSVDSISTSAGQEDHVSMGGWSARKLLKVIENVETIIAIELLMACQAIDFRRPNKTTAPLEAVHSLLRNSVPFLEVDRFLYSDIKKATEIIRHGRVWETAEKYVRNYIDNHEGGGNF